MYYTKYFEQIKNHASKNIIVLTGEENYLIDKFIQRLKEEHIVDSFEDFNYNRLDGKVARCSDIVSVAETMPMMSEKKLVIVEDFMAMSSKGGEAEDFDELKNYINGANPSTYLCFSFKEISMDKRKKITKDILKQAELIEFVKLKEDDLRRWISGKVKKLGKKILDKDIAYIIENSGYIEKNSEKTLYDIENEIIKVASYVGDSPYITEEALKVTMTRNLQNNIFELIEYISLGNKKNAVKLLDDMLLNNEPEQLILYMIIKHYRQLIFVKHLAEKGYGQIDIAEKLSINKYVVSKLLQQSRQNTLAFYKRAYEKTYETDKGIKKGDISARIGIELLIAKI